MKRYSQRLKKTESKARQLFSSLALLLLTFSCTKEFISTDPVETPVPAAIAYAYTIDLSIPQFAPQKIALDITGRIFVTGNGRRLLFIEERKTIEEITLESIYPCEIVDIDTDGFDVFLLDRLNKRIWTVKQKTILEKGFSLEDHPLHVAISKSSHMAITFSNRNEVNIFSRNDKLFTGIHLDAPLPDDDMVDMLFSGRILYIARRETSCIDVVPIFNPSQKYRVTVPSPTSLAIDRRGYLFIACKEGIGYLADSQLNIVRPLQNEHVEITIFNDSLFVLKPSAENIDVYSIVYAVPGTHSQ
jgi:hypothetical protein